MPTLFGNEEPKKKSLRDKLNNTNASLSSIAKGGEIATPNVSPSTVPGQAMESIAEGQKQPQQTSPSPTTPAEEPDEQDQSVAGYVSESQTLDGPETGKVKPENVPGPDAFAAFYRKWKSVPTEMNSKDRQMFTDKLAQLDQKMLEAEQEYKDNKNRLAWAEAAEQLGQAMVQLMAAQDASKNNWSVSGMKFDKNNWEGKFDRALKEFDSKKDTLSKQQSVVSRELDKADSKSEREGRSERSLMERDFFTTQARIEAASRRDAKEADAAGKDATSKERQAREKARGYIANYEAAEDAINKLASGEVDDPKEQQKLKDEVKASLRKNGHIGVSNDLPGAEKTGGFMGLFQSDDYSKMRAYVEANKKNGIKSVYRGFGVAVPSDVNEALSGDTKETPADKTEQPVIEQAPAGEVERITPDGKTAIYDAKTKQFLRWK